MDQRVGFREVCCDVAAWDVIGYQLPIIGYSSAAFEMRSNVDAGSRLPSSRTHVQGIHQDDAAIAMHSAVAVMKTIDRSIILVM